MPFTLKIPRRRAAGRTDTIRDSIAAKPQHWRRENFIPIRKAELIALLAGQADLSSEDRAAFEQLSRLLAATFHYDFLPRLEDLKNAYAVFDPDADTLPAKPIAPAERDARAVDLFAPQKPQPTSLATSHVQPL
ncbi:MAG TPA: hypothetical protein VMV69_13730 [Pirellulales bacterium]|nr:hypothetical protein [Pirellulales bacterium]